MNADVMTAAIAPWISRGVITEHPVAQAYQEEPLASDPSSALRHPASLRAPNGALEDSFYQAIGWQLYEGPSDSGQRIYRPPPAKLLKPWAAI
jgi:hypothetical protein